MTVDLHDDLEKVITFRVNDSPSNGPIIKNTEISNSKMYRLAVCMRYISVGNISINLL